MCETVFENGRFLSESVAIGGLLEPLSRDAAALIRDLERDVEGSLHDLDRRSAARERAIFEYFCTFVLLLFPTFSYLFPTCSYVFAKKRQCLNTFSYAFPFFQTFSIRSYEFQGFVIERTIVDHCFILVFLLFPTFSFDL